MELFEVKKEIEPPPVCQIIIAVGMNNVPYGGVLLAIEQDDAYGTVENEFSLCGNLEESLDLTTDGLSPGVYRVRFELIFQNEGLKSTCQAGDTAEYISAASNPVFTPISWPLI